MRRMSYEAASSPFTFPRDCLQFEPQVLRETEQPRSLRLDPDQRVDPHGVRRQEFVELHEWRIVPLCARREQIGNLGFGEVPGKVHDHAIFLMSGLNAAEHNARQTQKTIRRYCAVDR
jgi:hypothetical protein